MTKGSLWETVGDELEGVSVGYALNGLEWLLHSAHSFSPSVRDLPISVPINC